MIKIEIIINKVYSAILRISLAGTPPIKLFSGNDFVITDPAATTELLPIITPAVTVTFAPIQQFSPMCIEDRLVP